VSGDVRPITDEVAIKRALTNLILTPRGSKPFRPDYGSDVDKFLFRNPDKFTKNDLLRSLKDTIDRYESRINLINIDADFDDYGIKLNIKYRINNMMSQSNLALTVKRTA
jgi:phage baseplate assembly protein W